MRGGPPLFANIPRESDSRRRSNTPGNEQSIAQCAFLDSWRRADLPAEYIAAICAQRTVQRIRSPRPRAPSDGIQAVRVAKFERPNARGRRRARASVVDATGTGSAQEHYPFAEH